MSLIVGAATGVCGAGCTATARNGGALWPTTETWSQEGLTGRRFFTEHFELISTIRDVEFETALPGFLEAVYRRCEDVLPASQESEQRLTVYVFGSRAEWERFARRRFPKRYDVYARIHSGGFTEDTTSVLFHGGRSSTLATLAHEAWHQYVGANVHSPMPPWLNEGMACLLESVQERGGKFVFMPRENTFRTNALREGLQTDRLIPLDELVNTDAGKVIVRGHHAETQTYYAQTWGLVTFLQTGAGGKYGRRFDRMLADIADDTFRVHLSAASLAAEGSAASTPQRAVFAAYFGATPSELADAYYDHLVRLAGF